MCYLSSRVVLFGSSRSLVAGRVRSSWKATLSTMEHRRQCGSTVVGLREESFAGYEIGSSETAETAGVWMRKSSSRSIVVA